MNTDRSNARRTRWLARMKPSDAYFFGTMALCYLLGLANVFGHWTASWVPFAAWAALLCLPFVIPALGRRVWASTTDLDS